ncbi:MAG: AMP-dependent synthetase/ligase [Ignavibacterium sp.]
MGITKQFKTIPEMYQILTEEYIKNIKHPIIQYKPNNEWKEITYQQFKEEVETFAYGLATLGIKRGDKVAIMSENRPEWVYADLAIINIGAVDVPLYPSLTINNVEFILNNSDSIGIIVSNKLQLNKILKIKNNLKQIKFIIVMNEKDVVENTIIFSFKYVQELGRKFRIEDTDFLKNQISLSNENDLITIIYTSGTTGEQKGVMLSNKNIVSNIIDASISFNFGVPDIFLSFLPLCHIFERMSGYYTALANGAEIYYAQSIESVISDLQEVNPTLMTTVPRLFERMYSKIKKNIESQSTQKQNIFNWAIDIGYKYAEAKKIGSVPVSLNLKHQIADKLVFRKIKSLVGKRMRFFVSGGAALSRDVGEFFEAIGILILEGYGLTESSPVIAVNREDEYKFGTVGKLLPSVEVKIADDGEILARGPNIMLGYYKNKKETDETLKNGWLHTGDIGVFDTKGFLMITDRKKHLFKTSGGKYIAPSAIENLFLTSQYIDQFVLIGDRRMFLSALIVPDFESLKEYADSHNIYYTDEDDLVKKNDIYNLFEKEIVKFQKNLANYEKVRKFALLPKPFSLENGEITPTLKIKRQIVEERYKSLIDEMYEK